jgi:hypothetical protein
MIVMPTVPKIPHGCWPLEMTSDYAAGFVGEQSVEAFNKKVARGVYPQPREVKGEPRKWHRIVLELALARRHGLQVAVSDPEDDAASLI